jgi:hypothetical protein
MRVTFLHRAALGVAAAALAMSQGVDARHHVSRHGDPGHGHCLRFNKTTGAIAGAAGGAVLGKVIFGGPVAIVAGAAAGGIAGHKLARNGRKHCR